MLAPTRELAAQIRRELEPLARARGRSVCAVYGGVGYDPQTPRAAQGRRRPRRLPRPPGRPPRAERGSPRLGRASSWSTKPTAWPTWASSRRCASCSTRRTRTARRCCSRRRSTARSTCSPVSTRTTRFATRSARPSPTSRSARPPLLAGRARRSRRAHRRDHQRVRPDDRVLPHPSRCRSRRADARQAGVPAAAIHGGRTQNQRDRALAVVHARSGRGARRHRRRRARHPRRRCRVRRALRPARPTPRPTCTAPVAPRAPAHRASSCRSSPRHQVRDARKLQRAAGIDGKWSTRRHRPASGAHQCVPNPSRTRVRPAAVRRVAVSRGTGNLATVSRAAAATVSRAAGNRPVVAAATAAVPALARRKPRPDRIRRGGRPCGGRRCRSDRCA